MSIAPESTSDWRDLVDELTADQIATIEGVPWGGDYPKDIQLSVTIGGQMRGLDYGPAEIQLELARHYAEINLAQLVFCDVPRPAGAVEVSEWQPDDRGPATHYRCVEAERWMVESDGDSGAVGVCLAAVQWSDGAVVDHEIAVIERDFKGNDTLTAMQARQLGRALIAAADELDTLSGT